MENEENIGRNASNNGKRSSPADIVIGASANVDSTSGEQPRNAAQRSEAELWMEAGFNPVSATDNALLQFVLPEGYVAISSQSDIDRQAFIDAQKVIGLIPNFRFKCSLGEYAVYRLGKGVGIADFQYIIPVGLDFVVVGNKVPLPNYIDHSANMMNARHIGDIVTVALDDIARAAKRSGLTWPPLRPDPIMPNTPLLKHSLQGQADALEKLAKASRPLLGHVCLSGQASVWYAPPNSGKTLIGLALIVRAIRENLIEPDNVYYINADDNGTGLAEKLRILQDVGAHMLVPGFKKFRAGDLQGMLLDMAQTGKARGVVVVIDTIKKFASLMDKRDISGFADTCRQFVMHGGTILAFAHTNKNTTPNGSLKYAGTTDLIEDFDAGYIVTPLDVEQPGAERVVRFECIKRRGDSPDKAAFAYSTENGLTYGQLLASVEEVTFDKLGQVERHIQQRTDTELVDAIKACIVDGIDTKMQIAGEVAKRTKASGKSILKLLDRYTGDNPGEHEWSFRIGERGKHVFYLLPDTQPTD